MSNGQFIPMNAHNFHNLGRNNAKRREEAASRAREAKRLRDAGATGSEIASRLGVYIRVVWRYLAQAKESGTGLYV